MFMLEDCSQSFALIRKYYFDQFKIRGKYLNRLTIILAGRGCAHGTCYMCPLPKINTRAYKDFGNLYNVLDYILKLSNKRIHVLSVYNDGSYFSEKELYLHERQVIENFVSKSKIMFFSIDTLPQLINNDIVKDTLRRTNAELLVGIGLQSIDKRIRDNCIGSHITDTDIDEMFRVLDQPKVFIRIYLLYKPPFLNEIEAMDDLSKSLVELSKYKIENVSINPCKVSKNTLLEDIYKKGFYTTPHLYSIAKIIKTYPPENVTVEMPTKDNCPGEIALPHVCNKCNPVWANNRLNIIQFDKLGIPECWHSHLENENHLPWEKKYEQYFGNKLNNLKY